MRSISPVYRLLFCLTALSGCLLLFRNLYFTRCLPSFVGSWPPIPSCTDTTLLFLGWNIFLALLPWCFAIGFCRSSSRFPALCWWLLWLLFFPNAPYLLTDLIHLRPRSAVPYAYDIVLFLSFAATGLLFGAHSLLLVRNRLRQQLSARVVQGLVGSSILLCSCGIYIGRYLRWNSWDAFLRPWLVLQDSLSALASLHALVLVSGYTLILAGTYLLLRTRSRIYQME